MQDRRQDNALDEVVDFSQVPGATDTPPFSEDESEENALVPARKPAKTCSCGCRGVKAIHLKRVAYILPLAAAINEGVQTAVDMIGKPTALNATVTIINALGALCINDKFKNEGIDDSFQLCTQRGIPAEWPQLTTCKEVTAIGISSAAGTYSALCDGAVAFHYAHQFPNIYSITAYINMNGWKVGSVIFGGAIFANSAAGEGMATYRTTRELLAGTRTNYQNRASKIVCQTLGATIAVFGSINNGAQTCTSIYDVFGITSLDAKIGVLCASSVNGATDFCMNGTFVIDVIKIVLESAPTAYKDPKKMTVFILALASGALAGYVYQGLCKEAIEEILEALGVNYESVAATVVTDVLACGGATSMVINAGGGLHPFIRKGFDWVCSGVGYVYTKITSCCRTPHYELIENDDNDDVQFDTADEDDVVSDSTPVQPRLVVTELHEDNSGEDECDDAEFFDALTNDVYFQLSEDEEPKELKEDDDIFVDAVEHHDASLIQNNTPAGSPTAGTSSFGVFHHDNTPVEDKKDPNIQYGSP